MEIAVKGEVVTLIRGLKRPNLSSPKENWRVEATVEVPSLQAVGTCIFAAPGLGLSRNGSHYNGDTKGVNTS